MFLMLSISVSSVFFLCLERDSHPLTAFSFSYSFTGVESLCAVPLQSLQGR